MITIETKHIAAPDPSLSPFTLQITRLVDSCMVWVGMGESGVLCRDWACAMPPKSAGGPVAATSIFRSKDGDVALSMAQRLAKRSGKQVFLSLDVGEQTVEGIVRIEKGILSAMETWA